MASFRLTESAEADLYNIWCYTYQSWGLEQAENYTTSLKICCHNLAENPRSGRIAYEIGRNIRVYQYRYHHIFYIPDDNDIAIVAFLHEQMNMLEHLRERKTQH